MSRKKNRLKDPIATLLTKLAKTKQYLHILQKDNDHNNHYDHYKLYKTTKNPIYKQSNSKYYKILTASRKIKRFNMNYKRNTI